jgi:hypothetical protein
VEKVVAGVEKPAVLNRYSQIIERIFLSHYQDGATDVPFDRTEIVQVAADLGIALPKNLGDVLYSFRYRVPLPESIRARAPRGQEWIIRPAGRSLSFRGVNCVRHHT